MSKDLLTRMLTDMEGADELFRPTNYWSSGLDTIVQDLTARGFGDFRDHPSAHEFYVPVYRNRKLDRPLSLVAGVAGRVAGRKVGRRIREVALNEERAFQEYRLLKAADTPGGLPLAGVSESTYGKGEQFEFGGAHYSRPFLNYLRGVAFLKKHLPTDDLSSIMEIGGGYGTLGEILLKSRSDGFYLDIDIPPVAAVATHYLQQVFGKDAVFTYEDVNGPIDIDAIRKRYRAAVICPWQLPQVVGSVDLFANFISFQEMEPHVVKNYATLLQPHVRQAILLRNSARGKVEVDEAGKVGVMKATTTDDMAGYFDQFSLVARDSAGAGHEGRDSTFRSEVLCLKRKG